MFYKVFSVAQAPKAIAGTREVVLYQSINVTKKNPDGLTRQDLQF
jgi:hypothetical protein